MFRGDSTVFLIATALDPQLTGAGFTRLYSYDQPRLAKSSALKKRRRGRLPNRRSKWWGEWEHVHGTAYSKPPSLPPSRTELAQLREGPAYIPRYPWILYRHPNDSGVVLEQDLEHSRLVHVTLALYEGTPPLGTGDCSLARILKSVKSTGLHTLVDVLSGLKLTMDDRFFLCPRSRDPHLYQHLALSGRLELSEQERKDLPPRVATYLANFGEAAQRLRVASV